MGVLTMKIDQETLIVLYMVMDNLSKGIDPTSNISFAEEDTILNSSLLKKSFTDAANIFKYLENNLEETNKTKSKRITNNKYSFYITKTEFEKIPISDTPITISKFTYAINEICNRSEMKKLKATQITEWLNKNGYLQIIICNNGDECKKATELGKEIGIISETKVNSRGYEYILNTYDSSAQSFLKNNVLPQIAKIIDI